MITSYKIRVDTDDITKVRELIDRYSDRYILSFEGGFENPHVHGYFETTTKQLTIRARIRKFFGSGNGIYSLKELDEIFPFEYIAYILKDGDYQLKGVTEEEIQKAKEFNIEVKKQIKEKKAKKRTQLQVLDDKFHEQYTKEGEYYIDSEGRIPTQESIVTMIVQYYLDEKKLFRQFQIVSLSQTLSARYVPSYKSTYIQKIYQML